MGILYSELELDDVVMAAKGVADDDSAPMHEIVRRFWAAAYKIAAAVVGERFDLLDDVANAAMYAVVTAVRKHSGNTGCVAYIKIYMTGAAKRSFMKLKGEYTEPLDSPAAEKVIETLFAADEVLGWGDGDLADVVVSLNESQRELLWRRYGLVFTLKEIAMVKKVSVSAVSQQLTTAHKVILAKIA